MDVGHQTLQQRCPHLHGQSIAHTRCVPSFKQLFKMPPNQHNKLQRRKGDVGEEEEGPSKLCGAHWQERRTAMDGAP